MRDDIKKSPYQHPLYVELVDLCETMILSTSDPQDALLRGISLSL